LLKGLCLVSVLVLRAVPPVLLLQSLFMSMDKDDDGRISAGDLHRAIEQVGYADSKGLCWPAHI